MRVAITGGVCDGKTTVLSFLKAQGLPGISADEVVSELYGESDFRNQFKIAFGEEAVTGDTINRAWLREKTFTNQHFRRRLNSWMHTLILKRMLSWGERIPKTSFYEVPLLIETVTHPYFDEVWVVDAGEEERMRRLLERFQGNEEMARRVLEAQLPTKVKHAFADRIVRTDFPLHTVNLLIEKIVSDMDF